MGFFEHLKQETITGQQYLLEAPIIRRCFKGDVTVDDYVAFLQQAYHHVKHTTPLLMTAGGRIPEEKEWLRNAVAEYIEEELGHQEWVLNDIASCGYDKECASKSRPGFSTELMVAYAYDSINRISPLCLFGMVHVLEGTSILLAENAAMSLAKALSLPQTAFTYLHSHGVLDKKHVKFFQGLMNRITDPHEQQFIIESARVFYRLYGNILRELNADHNLARAA